MKLRFMKGRMSGHMADVLPTGFVVGRDPECDLTIDADGISRRHARFFFEDGTWFVEDLGSTNGIRVNGTKVAGRFCIKNGDRIGLYNQTFLFTDDAGVVDIDALVGDLSTVSTPVPAPSLGNQPTLPAGTPGQPVQQSSSNMSGVKILVLLIAVAALAWFAKDWLTRKPQAEPDDNAPPTTVTQGDSSLNAGAQAGNDESPDTTGEKPVTDTGTTGGKPAATDMAGSAASADHNPTAGNDTDATRPVVTTKVPPVVVVGTIRKKAVDMFIESVPSGAGVSLNGVAKGKTPILLRNIDAGEYDLLLSSAGYKPLEQSLRLPEEVPNKPFTLQLAPGAVRVTSTPAGATVLHGTQVLGTTPLVTTDLPVGSQELRIVKYRFESQRQTVMVSAAMGTDVTVTLKPLMGALELVTVPPGCNVYIDNVFKGKTAPRQSGTTGKSAPLRITGLREGKHQVRAEHLNGAAKSAVVTVEPGKVDTVFVNLWVVDTKVTLQDGTEKFGMYLGKNADGDVALSEKAPGVKGAQTKTYFKEQLLKTEAVPPREGRLKTEHILAAEKATRQPAGQPVNPDVFDGGSLDKNAVLTYTTKSLNNLIQSMGAIALSKRVGAHEVVFKGVPTAVEMASTRTKIHFGKMIICEMSNESYTKISTAVETAREIGTVITMRGRMIATTKNLVTLLNCTCQEEGE